MPDLSRFNQDVLFRELEGKPLNDYLSRYAFVDPDEHQKQTPSIYPLGELHYKDDDGGRGGGEIWLTDDEAVLVFLHSDGTIQMVLPSVTS